MLGRWYLAQRLTHVADGLHNRIKNSDLCTYFYILSDGNRGRVDALTA
jgi:hypothetical protein